MANLSKKILDQGHSGRSPRARQPKRGGATELNKMKERIVKIEGQEFVITKGKGDCELNVTNGDDMGRVSWHAPTQRYRGDFKGWGSDSDSIDGAIANAARRILSTRRGVSKKEACEAMDKYLEG